MTVSKTKLLPNLRRMFITGCSPPNTRNVVCLCTRFCGPSYKRNFHRLDQKIKTFCTFFGFSAEEGCTFFGFSPRSGHLRQFIWSTTMAAKRPPFWKQLGTTTTGAKRSPSWIGQQLGTTTTGAKRPPFWRQNKMFCIFFGFSAREAATFGNLFGAQLRTRSGSFF